MSSEDNKGLVRRLYDEHFQMPLGRPDACHRGSRRVRLGLVRTADSRTKLTRIGERERGERASHMADYLDYNGPPTSDADAWRSGGRRRSTKALRPSGDNFAAVL